jgi:Protein of unknown function (DUF2846)
MKFPNFALLVLFTTLGLVGCATGPSFSEYSAKQKPPAPGQGRVWFYRPSKLLGAAVQPSVMLNEVKVGKAQPGCFFLVDRNAGSYEAKCTTEWSHKAKFTLAPNEEKFMRLSILPGFFVGHISPNEVDHATGLKEIAGCRLITADGANAELR